MDKPQQKCSRLTSEEILHITLPPPCTRSIIPRAEESWPATSLSLHCTNTRSLFSGINNERLFLARPEHWRRKAHLNVDAKLSFLDRIPKGSLGVLERKHTLMNLLIRI